MNVDNRLRTALLSPFYRQNHRLSTIYRQFRYLPTIYRQFADDNLRYRPLRFRHAILLTYLQNARNPRSPAFKISRLIHEFVIGHIFFRSYTRISTYMPMCRHTIRTNRLQSYKKKFIYANFFAFFFINCLKYQKIFVPLHKISKQQI